MKRCPSIVAETVLLAAVEGGRRASIFVGYRPHIVIQDRSVRVATYDANGMGNEQYLGISFQEVPSGYELGRSAEFRMELMYWPRIDYSRVEPGATFTIREGGKVVGHGIAVSRRDPPDCE